MLSSPNLVVNVLEFVLVSCEHRAIVFRVTKKDLSCALKSCLIKDYPVFDAVRIDFKDLVTILSFIILQ